MHDHIFSVLANHQIRAQVKWVVNLVIADGHFKLSQEFEWYVWVNILNIDSLHNVKLSIPS